ncbi:VRR-NUC domain-containing protein [Paraburkholderia tropica]|uniref:VRR-NUC domain-containing protein n=1 Tax=Paraburkholderia tropica TaxID=92647 RepID=A0ABX5MU25_9BURK|nr:VRR-NUC domain-containing protein [Paraburkholderia tropica]MDE1144506.1 VRR-NUC domain-containing protein [Paraburkholderia tropica]PXX17398.1 VRR-NUC domain-containing protein [Paraburkholderia tropica]PZW84579.1 VRR-NUC domain-containing protein [Paraburkholderia tropica]
MGSSLKPAGECETIKERTDQYAYLPPRAKGYLEEKVRIALMLPTIVRVQRNDGTSIDAYLKQTVVTEVIRVEERVAEFWWRYKAEVSFDLSEVRIMGLKTAPIPFLSDEKLPQPGGRRHSMNPFPKGYTKGALRRPDVIIVHRPEDRWPGRGERDREGGGHMDNLLRLVEIKFPGDVLNEGQERDYLLIAGSKDRMSVLDVSDCDDDLEHARALYEKGAYPNLAELREMRLRMRAPVRTVEAIPQSAWYEDWSAWLVRGAGQARQTVANAVSAVWNATGHGYAYVSDETQQFLHAHVKWVFSAGRWVADETHATWKWVDDKGSVLCSYTAAELKAGWAEIRKQTDLTWATLRNIDWGHVGVTIVKGLVTLVVIIAAVAVAVVLTEALFAILAALMAIIGAGAAATAALAAVLGVAAAEAA